MDSPITPLAVDQNAIHDRAERVDVPVPAHPRLEWVSVHGPRLLADGRETRTVTVLVRVAALTERK
ncbi:hypothetical protein GCM10009682_59570 [Luedemannella flava]|uniref:Uncharacterized protein n=1 Tax=Luedemannella flava TaxID=349316 RepID=A0ABP4YWU9_9ACTN